MTRRQTRFGFIAGTSTTRTGRRVDPRDRGASPQRIVLGTAAPTRHLPTRFQCCRPHGVAAVGGQVTVTVPLPVPLAPPVIDIHPRSDVAFHVQLLAIAVTLTELDPPLAANERDEADNV